MIRFTCSAFPLSPPSNYLISHITSTCSQYQLTLYINSSCPHVQDPLPTLPVANLPAWSYSRQTPHSSVHDNKFCLRTSWFLSDRPCGCLAFPHYNVAFPIIHLSPTIHLPAPYWYPADCPPGSGSIASTSTCSAFPLPVPLPPFRLVCVCVYGGGGGGYPARAPKPPNVLHLGKIYIHHSNC